MISILCAYISTAMASLFKMSLPLGIIFIILYILGFLFLHWLLHVVQQMNVIKTHLFQSRIKIRHGMTFHVVNLVQVELQHCTACGIDDLLWNNTCRTCFHQLFRDARDFVINLTFVDLDPYFCGIHSQNYLPVIKRPMIYSFSWVSIYSGLLASYLESWIESLSHKGRTMMHNLLRRKNEYSGREEKVHLFNGTAVQKTCKMVQKFMTEN